jgi:putative DNA primase/helicase
LDDHVETEEEIRRDVEKRAATMEAMYPDTGLNNGVVSSEFIKQCLNANNLGDGLLYAAVNKDLFIFNVTEKEWLKWNGQHWEMDRHNQSFAAVENVVSRLLEEANLLGERISWAIKGRKKDMQNQLENRRDFIYTKIESLRKPHGRNACVNFAVSNYDPITIDVESLDTNPWLLACENGVIDLRTGYFRDGRPDDYITMASPVKWVGFGKKPELWLKFLREIFNGDEELIAYIHKLLGYAITGSTREHIMPVFFGKGRNGKGTLVRVLLHVMGPLAGTIQSEILLRQKIQNSPAGPSPHILDLKGLRLAFASETEQGQQFSASKVKWLTGGDRLVARGLMEKKQIRFDPSHTIFLMTNNRPTVSGDDYAFWKRMHLIPFTLSYVLNKSEDELEDFERIADPDLEDKLKEEITLILPWLVEGCLLYQREGLSIPTAVKKETENYRQDEDTMGQFLDGYCKIVPSVRTKSSEIFEVFQKWYKKNYYSKGTSQKFFGSMMKKRFDTTKISGVVHYIGVELDILKTVELDEK